MIKKTVIFLTLFLGQITFAGAGQPGNDAVINKVLSGTKAGDWNSTNISNTIFTSVSCPSTSFCIAVDADGNAYRYNGTQWSSAKHIDKTGYELTTISCPNSSFCMAVDEAGGALSYNGSTWSRISLVDGNNSITSISCPTGGFCIAVDNVGNVLQYNAGTVLYPHNPEEYAKTLWFERSADTALSDITYKKIFTENVIIPVLLNQKSNNEIVEHAILKELPQTRLFKSNRHRKFMDR